MVDVHDLNEPTGPREWFESLPIVTRYWFGGACLVTLAGNFEFISISHFFFSHKLILQKFELWRVLTCFLYAGPFSFPMVVLMYMLLTNSQAYEQGGPFNTGAGGGTADYITALIFAVVLILIRQVLIYPMMPLFVGNLVYFVMYLWSRRNPTLDVKFWGIVPTKALYVPFFVLGLVVVTGNDPRPVVEGYVIGHLYFFLVDIAPVVYGKTMLQTPQFLIDQFGTGIYHRGVVPAQAAPAGNRPQWRATQTATTGGGYNWGSGGRSLGRN